MAKAKRKPAPQRNHGEPPPLTFRQRQFVSYYLNLSQGNASDAARRAGYSNDNIGRQLLRNITIRAAIAAHLASSALSADETLARLSEIATGELGQFVSVTKAGRVSIDWQVAKKLGLTRLIRKIEQGKNGVKIELHSALDALKTLAQHHALLIGKDEGPEDDEVCDPAAARRALAAAADEPEPILSDGEPTHEVSS